MVIGPTTETDDIEREGTRLAETVVGFAGGEWRIQCLFMVYQEAFEPSRIRSLLVGLCANRDGDLSIRSARCLPLDEPEKAGRQS